jgi:hypothetical protein
MQQTFAASAAYRPKNQSAVHSQVLPHMSYKPYPFGGKLLTGDVRS